MHMIKAVQLSIAEKVDRLGLLWHTVIESYDLMKNIYLASNKDCCRNLFYLCNQAMINQAELKKKY